MDEVINWGLFFTNIFMGFFSSGNVKETSLVCENLCQACQLT